MKTNLPSSNNNYNSKLVPYDAAISNNNNKNRTEYQIAIEHTLKFRESQSKNSNHDYGYHCTINCATVLLIDSSNGEIKKFGTAVSSASGLHAEINALYTAIRLSKEKLLSKFSDTVIDYLNKNKYRIVVFTERAPCITTSNNRDISCHAFFEYIFKGSGMVNVYFAIPTNTNAQKENVTLGLLLPAAFDTLSSLGGPSILNNCINSSMQFKAARDINVGGGAPEQIIFYGNPLVYAKSCNLGALRYQKPNANITLPQNFNENTVVNFNTNPLYLNLETLIADYKSTLTTSSARQQQNNNNNSNVSSTTTTTTISTPRTQSNSVQDLTSTQVVSSIPLGSPSQKDAKLTNLSSQQPIKQNSSDSQHKWDPLNPWGLKKPQSSNPQNPNQTTSISQSQQQNPSSSVNTNNNNPSLITHSGPLSFGSMAISNQKYNEQHPNPAKSQQTQNPPPKDEKKEEQQQTAVTHLISSAQSQQPKEKKKKK